MRKTKTFQHFRKSPYKSYAGARKAPRPKENVARAKLILKQKQQMLPKLRQFWTLKKSKQEKVIEDMIKIISDPEYKLTDKETLSAVKN